MRRKYFEGDDCCFSELGGSSVTGGGSCGALGGSGNFVVALNPEYVGVMCDNELTDTERLFMAQNIEAEGEGVDKQCEKWESEICDTEGCFSVPYKRGVVRRFHAACLLLSTVLFVRCCCGVGRLACSNMRPIIWRDDFTMIQWLLGVCPSPMCRWSSVILIVYLLSVCVCPIFSDLGLHRKLVGGFVLRKKTFTKLTWSHPIQ